MEWKDRIELMERAEKVFAGYVQTANSKFSIVEKGPLPSIDAATESIAKLIKICAECLTVDAVTAEHAQRLAEIGKNKVASGDLRPPLREQREY